VSAGIPTGSRVPALNSRQTLAAKSTVIFLISQHLVQVLARSRKNFTALLRIATQKVEDLLFTHYNCALAWDSGFYGLFQGWKNLSTHEESKTMYQELPEHTESYLASLVVLSAIAFAMILLFTMTPM